MNIVFNWDGAETEVFENDADGWTVASGSDTLFVGADFLECLNWIYKNGGIEYLLISGKIE